MSGIAVQVEVQLGKFSLMVNALFPGAGTTVVLGPSGAGKTTLLRIIAGLERKATGSIQIANEYLMDTSRGIFVPPHRRAVGYVFQDGRLFPHLSVRGNLDYARKRAREGVGSSTAEQIVRIFHIEHLLERSPSNLSGGEIQRVAIARALLTNPRLLVMDEPLSALDLPRRAEVLAYLETVPRLFGIPVIYITHAIEEAARIAMTLAIVNDGRIIAVGPASEILARLDLSMYLGRFEAGTILEGIIADIDQAYGMSLVETEGTMLQVPSLGMEKGSRVRLHIRARDVSLALSKPKDISIRNIIRATIAEIAEEKDSAFAEVRLQTGSQALRARITRRSLNELALKPGQEVHALIKSIAVDRQLYGGRERHEADA